jgi:CheY-like chemotaxis protein
LPLQQPSLTAQNENARVTTPAASWETLRVENRELLLAEPDPSVQNSVQQLLSSLGYKVTCCGGSLEALQQCSAQRFDLLLVDSTLPGMPTKDLLNKVAASCPKLPVVVLAPQSQAELPQGASAVVPKPLDLTTLASKVKEALGAQASPL